MGELHARRSIRAKALRSLSRFTLPDLLRELTIGRLIEEHPDDRDLAPVTKHQFYEVAGYRSRDAGELVDELVEEATAAESRISDDTIRRVLQLLGQVRRRHPPALSNLKYIAADNIRDYFTDPEERRRDVVRMLVAATRSGGNGDTRHHRALAGYYQAVTEQYQAMYEELLSALGRRPIEAIGDVQALAICITAFADGLVLRGLIDDEIAPNVLFGETIIPIFAALTAAIGHDDPTDAERVWGANAQPAAGGA